MLKIRQYDRMHLDTEEKILQLNAIAYEKWLISHW